MMNLLSMVNTYSLALTDGIRVRVESRYVPEQSAPLEKKYVFAYAISISNEGKLPAQLHSRHWIITDGTGHVEEVNGAGVVGSQPYLSPGQSFEYMSGCVLKTPTGQMRGSYLMVREDGSRFEAEIAAFALVLPKHLN